SVLSISRPSSILVAVSLTTRQVTPMMSLVSPVTANSSRWPFPSRTPSKTSVVPGVSGKNGLSTTATKFAGSMVGRYPDEVGDGMGEGIEVVGGTSEGEGDVAEDEVQAAPSNAARPSATITFLA